MPSFRIPGTLEVGTRIFGHLTVKDLTRLLTPATAAYLLLQSIPAVLAALAIGAAWYLWTPYNQHLDTLLRNLVRWNTTPEKLESAKPRQKTLETEEAVTAVLQITPSNLDIKTEAEKKAVHSVYQELLDEVNYSFKILSKQEDLSLEDYRHSIAHHKSPQKGVKAEYSAYCGELSQRNLSTTTHYIAVRAEKHRENGLTRIFQGSSPDRGKNLRRELASRCREIIETINRGDLQVELVTSEEIKELNHVQPGLEPSANWSSLPETSGGEYRKTLYISDYPSSVELGWPIQLLRVNGLVDITQIIKPKKPGRTAKKLQRTSQKLDSEIDSVLRQGYRGTNKLETLLDDTEWMLDLLAERKCTPVEHGVYITAKGESEADCLQTLRQVQNRLDTLQIDYTEPVLRTDQALHTTHPANSDKLDETQLVPSTGAAAGFPFGTQPRQEDYGVIYGVDTRDGTPILADRFQWTSHSMARMGTVGSGKSYAAKLELLRTSLIYDNLQIIIVDPKQEYGVLTKCLSGEVYNLDNPDVEIPDSNVCYQVHERGQEENVDLLTDLVRSIYSHASNTEKKTLVLIDEARILLNDEEGRQVLNQFVLEGRDTNTAVTLVTQNASHFTHCREGREILDNVPCKVFMRHERVPDSVVDYFQLSERERQELYELKTGTDSPYSEALLKISGRLDTRVKVEATDVEDTIINHGEEE